MRHYDHRKHAGNAGDVWKHFLLLEAADCLLTPDSSLVYAESHVGRPTYSLKAAGDWEGGIGRIWPTLHSLKNFCYFDILAKLNPRGPVTYPGSAWLVCELARRKRSKLEIEAWDIDPNVAAAWSEYPERTEIPSISIHLGNGFSGVTSLLNQAAPGLLLIDPPFLESGDAGATEELFGRARESGWTVLCWYLKDMKDMKNVADTFQEFSIRFDEIGLDYAGAKGCAVAVSSPNYNVVHRLEEGIEEFRKTIQKIDLVV